MSTQNLLLRISPQGQLTLPKAIKDLGYEANKQVKAVITEAGEIILSKPVSQTQRLAGKYAGLKIKKEYEELSDREIIETAKKLQYGQKTAGY